jgi:hypothetical protein
MAERASATTVAITSPAASATVKGTVPVTAKATANGSDTVSSITFYDGVNSIGSASCDGQTTCTATINWRATGLTGLHSLTARAFTRQSDTGTSPVVSVTVETPPPTVVIDAPGAGAVVKGTIPVSASAATDPALADYPKSITVYDGVNSIGSFTCQGQTTCSGVVNWRATGLTGPHALSAKVYTDQSVTGVSASTVVTVVTPPPSVQITSPKSGAGFRSKMTIAVSAATDPALADYPTSIEVFDGTSRIGGVSCQGQITCSGSLVWTTTGLKGRHALSAVVHTDQGARATSAKVTVGQRLRTKAKISCSLSTTHARIGKRVRGTCTAPGVPKGTKVAIRYRTGSRGPYLTAVRTKAGRDGGFHFTLKGSRRATFRLVATVSSNSRYLKTTKSIGTLRIG